MTHIIKNILACLAFIMPLSVFGENATLSIEPFSLEAGQEQELLIDLNNPSDELTLVQFDLYLPAGLSIKQTDGELVFDMCDRTTWRKHTLDANQISDGHYRFLLYSSSNALISGTEGAVIKTTLVADNSFTGGNIVIGDALLVTPDQKEIKPETYTYALNYHADNYGPFIYFIGTTDGWSSSDQKLESTAADGIYTGFVYIADPYGWGIEFKFQKRAGDWADDSQLNSNNVAVVKGDFEKTGDNFKASLGEGVYFVEINLQSNTITGTKINNMNLVGAFNVWNSGDDAQQMTWNPDEYCYEITGAGVTSDGWKFTANNGWDINLGGETLDELVQNGNNLVEVGTTIKLYPTRKTSDKIYCTVENTVPAEKAFLSIEPFVIAAGETKEMLIELTNPDDELTLVQFDLSLPAGLSIKQTGGELAFDMCDRTTWRKHTLDANQISDGHYRFLLYSSSNALISGTEGAVIKTTLVADNSFTGGNIVIGDALLVTPDQKEIKPETYEYSLPKIEQVYYFTGTLNGWDNRDTSYKLTNDGSSPYDNPIYTCRIPADDGNIIEFKMTPESGLGGDWMGCLSATANNEEGRFAYNNEGDNLVIYSVTDAVFYDLTFNMIEQTWSYEAVYAPISNLSIEPFDITSGETKEMLIDLTNPDDELTLVQFDLHLPAGLSIMQAGGELDFDMCDRTTWRKHTLDANQISDGHYRFLLYSGSNALISGSEGAIIKMTLVADNNFDYQGQKIVIDNTLLVSPEQKEIKPRAYEYALPAPSGIHAVSEETGAQAHVYSLSGQRLPAPRKGINIIGGKKVVVK